MASISDYTINVTPSGGYIEPPVKVADIWEVYPDLMPLGEDDRRNWPATLRRAAEFKRGQNALAELTE